MLSLRKDESNLINVIVDDPTQESESMFLIVSEMAIKWWQSKSDEMEMMAVWDHSELRTTQWLVVKFMGDGRLPGNL